jgi:bifunctional pyridoxal-dependent enzyme with beta-cystathionase and maltose regulon repressor activities
MKPQATFFLFPDISAFGMSSTEMTDYLKKEARIIVQSGSDFGPCGEGHIRLNFGTAMDVLEEAFNRMEKALSRLEITRDGITPGHG